MPYIPMKIPGAWIYEPITFTDERGTFHEVFKASEIRSLLGRDFELRQVNQSVSAAGVIRGIHWADVPPGQAKHVSCVSGSLWDVVVDLRRSSPTFGQWDAVVLSEKNRRSVLISEGLGHCFLSLEDQTLVNYLVSSEYSPGSERDLNPFDPHLAINFEQFKSKINISEFILSSKDKKGPSLEKLISDNLLPE